MVRGLTADPLDSVELAADDMTSNDERITVSAEEGARLSAVDVARFSRSVFTVRLLTYRGCWGRFSGLRTLVALPAATAARTAMANVDSVTLLRIPNGVRSVGILGICGTEETVDVEGIPRAIC